jgi:hypothetical protein
MSSVLAGSPARAPAIHDRHATDHTGQASQAGRGREPGPSRMGVLLEALAYAGACIDPTGVLAYQRLARNPEQTQLPAILQLALPRGRVAEYDLG